MQKEQITLIGRGWLGSPLGESLEHAGHSLFCTTSKDFDIAKDKFPAHLINSDILIYTIPPMPLDVVQGFFSTIPSDKKIVFISSTSVYGKNQGAVDENRSPLPETESGKLLLETEKFLRERFKKATIIRPGGLYGKARHPLFSLKGKMHLKNGEEFAHLAHQQDCIQAILAIIKKNLWGETFNLVSDLKMKKKDYYEEMAKKLNLVAPTYDEVPLENPTEISNDKSKKMLSLLYFNPLDYN